MVISTPVQDFCYNLCEIITFDMLNMIMHESAGARICLVGTVPYRFKNQARNSRFPSVP
jgi:hypothetical protein